MQKYLIINADGYGFTPGTTRAIEECIEFGTVRSISVNVNFPDAERLTSLCARYPDLSVGCHVNPVVGRPVLDARKVQSLVNDDGEFWYRDFEARALFGRLNFKELYSEMTAQVKKTRELAGRELSHIDFHRGVHRLPVLYNLFLEVAKDCGISRVRTHRYLVGLGSENPKKTHAKYLLKNPVRTLVYVWNLWLDRVTHSKGFSSPSRRVVVEPCNSAKTPKISVDSFVRMLRNLPSGYSELVVHPGYVDEKLRRYSTYLEPREMELQVLTNPFFKSLITAFGVRLVGYQEIPKRRV